MLVEIKQITGKKDRSPNKAALINEANILDALHKEWADEDFEIKIIESRPVQKLVIKSESSSGAAAEKIDKITLEQAHQLADSIIGKLYRRGYIEEHRKDERLLKQIIVQHFYELK